METEQLERIDAAMATGEKESERESEGADPQRRRRKSIHRRAEILRHARRLFEQTGFHETSLDDIARAVGIRREGLYYYYRNRAEILVDIVRPQNEALIARMEEIVAADLAPATKLFLAIKSHVCKFDRTSLDMVIVGIGGAADSEVGSVHAAVAPLYRTYQDHWLRLIRQGQRAGVFERGIDAKLAVFALLGMCNWTAMWFDADGEHSLEDIATVFYRLTSSGLLRLDDGEAGDATFVRESMLREAKAFESRTVTS